MDLGGTDMKKTYVKPAITASARLQRIAAVVVSGENPGGK